MHLHAGQDLLRPIGIRHHRLPKAVLARLVEAAALEQHLGQLGTERRVGGVGFCAVRAAAGVGGELAGSSTALTAVDSDDQRLQRVAENLDRLGLDATLVNADASMPDSWWDGQPFDQILLDAPCSASGGTIFGNPDSRSAVI